MSGELLAERVSIAYGKRVVVNDVSVRFSSGTVTAIIGPSGCGKSSFLGALNRLHDLNPAARVAGRIVLDGEDTLEPNVDVQALRRRVGMLFQRPNPFPLSIERNISLALEHHGVRGRHELSSRVEHSLTAAGLWHEVKDDLRRSALTLSGGQQQRLCLARALALGPDVLLMDEPCSALDPHSTAHIEELIAQLRHRYTIIIVTHNLAQARRTSNETVCLWLQDGVGTVIERGPTDRLLSNPERPEVRDYVAGRLG